MTSPDPMAFKIGEGVIELVADGSALPRQVREEVKAAGAGQEIVVPIKYDSRGYWRDAQGKLRDEKGRFAKAGEVVGEGGGMAAAEAFKKSFSDSLARFKKGTDMFAKFDFLPIPPMLFAIAGAALPAAAGILALGSSLGLAASAGAAFLPAALGAVAGIGGIMLAVKGVSGVIKEHSALAGLTGDAWVKANEQYQASLAKLTPAAQGFVKTLFSMSDEAKKISKAAEAGLFPGLTTGLERLRGLLPDIAVYVGAITAQLGRAGANLGGFLGGEPFRSQLRDIMTQNTIAATAFASSATPIATIFTDISQAAAPLVARFAEAWLNATLLIADWIELRRQSGALAEYFRAAGTELGTWWGILKNFTIGLIQLFGYALPAGQETARVLFLMSAAFRDWAGSEQARAGVTKLLEIVAGIDVARLLGVAAAVASMGVAFKALSGISGIVGVVSALAGAGPVGLAIGAIVVVVGALAAALGYLYVVMEPVREIVNGVISAFRDQFGPVLSRVTDFIRSEVAPVVTSGLVATFRVVGEFLTGTLFPALRQGADVWFPQVANAWRQVVGAFGDNSTQLKTLGTWIGEIIKYFVRLLPVGFAISGFLYQVFGQSIKFTISVIGWLVDAIHGIGAVFTWLWNESVRIWNAITSTLGSAFSYITGIVMYIGGFIGGIFQSIWNTVSSVFNMVVSAIRFALDIIVQLFNIAWTWVDQLTGGRLTLIRDTIVNSITIVRDWISSTLTSIVAVWDAVWGWVGARASEIWGSITSVVSAAITVVRDTISSVLGAIGEVFSAFWTVLRIGWESAWSWVANTASSWVDRIRGVFTGMRDHISDVFHSLPRLIVGALNAMISGINLLIGRVNGILPGNPIPTLGLVNVPQGYAVGGRVIGPGTGTSDDIPIMASNGEFVLRAKAVDALERAYGRGFLESMNGFDVHGDPSLAVARRRYADGGLITSTQAWIRAQDPKPYVLGSNGPDAWDCSSLVGGVWALLTGQNPYRRYFTTYTLPQAGGFVPGKGTYTIGLSREHVVGNLAGLKFEAANSSDGIIVGNGATDVDRMPAQYFLPQAGDKFIGGGFSLAQLFKNIIDEAVSGVRGKLPQPGGMINPIITGLFDLSVDKLRKWSFDNGGVLPPGPSIAVNRTGRNEQVLSPEQIDILAGAAAGGGASYHFAAGAITLDASKIKSVEDLLALIESLNTTARQYGVRAGV